MTTMISEVYSAFKAAGIPEQEAKQAAEALSAENLATTNTVAENRRELSAEITGSKQELSGQIVEVDKRLSGQIAEVDKRLSGQIAEVKQELLSKIAELRHEMTTELGKIKRGMNVMQWMLGLVLFAVALPILREIIVI